MKQFLYRIVCGFFIGISIFAPGVSGSVMAVIMGIYNTLLEIVSNPFKNLRRNVALLFPMGIGALISLALFVLVFSYLFETYETATYLLFLGLIAGNLPVVYRSASTDGFKRRYALAVLIAFAIAVAMGSAVSPEAGGRGAALADNLLYLAVCGAVAGVAGIVPGMSVSVMLMVFGVYDHLMLAAKHLDLPVIAATGLGFVLGMVAFSRFVQFIFRRYHNFASFMVFGFICGSLVGIVLQLPPLDPGFHWLTGLLSLAAGLAVSTFFCAMGKKLNLADT